MKLAVEKTAQKPQNIRKNVNIIWLYYQLFLILLPVFLTINNLKANPKVKLKLTPTTTTACNKPGAGEILRQKRESKFASDNLMSSLLEAERVSIRIFTLRKQTESLKEMNEENMILKAPDTSVACYFINI